MTWSAEVRCRQSNMSAYLRKHTELHQISVHVAYGRGSILCWWRCDTLCTSGFVDDVVFVYSRLGKKK